jgi:putative tryptophan/tyrosine transport system substrate-binding protein
LHQVGWVDGRNVVIHYRWGAGDNERIRKSAQELVALAPDAILAVGAVTVSPLRIPTKPPGHSEMMSPGIPT